MDHKVKVTVSFEYDFATNKTEQALVEGFPNVDEWIKYWASEDEEQLFTMISDGNNLTLISIDPIEEPVDEFTMAVVHAEKSLSDE